MVKCGPSTILYEYPAWSFGLPRKRNDETLGPGPGSVVPRQANTIGPCFGPAHGPLYARAHGPHGHGGPTKAGVSSTERTAPSHSFGKLLDRHGNNNPGPLHYQVPAWPQNKNASSSWGPPPSRRAASAPRPIRQEEPVHHKAKGPSFGLPYHEFKPTGYPGPTAYGQICAGCCMACQGYKGHSFGLRPPIMYGRNTTNPPGPNAYKTDCSTIGAATRPSIHSELAFAASRAATAANTQYRMDRGLRV